MNHRQMVDLANVIHNIRPDWDQPGIVSQLSILNANWDRTPTAFVIHAATVAGDPTAKTPGAINTYGKLTPDRTSTQTRISKAWTSEPICYICSQPQSWCIRRHERELSRGVPDPHQFQTREEAEQLTAKSRQ